MTDDLVRRLEALAQEVDYEPEGTELGPLAAVLEFLHEPEVYEALRALSQPGREPVAEVQAHPSGGRYIQALTDVPLGTKLYAHPPAGDAGGGPLYRHADGGLYVYRGEAKFKGSSGAEWQDVVVYTAAKPPRLQYVTTLNRWRERFKSEARTDAVSASARAGESDGRKAR